VEIIEQGIGGSGTIEGFILLGLGDSAGDPAPPPDPQDATEAIKLYVIQGGNL
jgi:hypothetical protein